MKFLRVFVIFLFLLKTASLEAQNSAMILDSSSKTLSNTDTAFENSMPIIVGDIQLSGNKKTKSFIVLREVPFHKNDRIIRGNMDKLLTLARQQLMNTSLFVDVAVIVSSIKGNVWSISIELKERWYLFPLPYFKLIDRNFNQWWVDQNKSLERVNYGVKFIQNNISGRNDNLDIWLITGYTQQITLRYTLPFFDKKLKSGFSIGMGYGTQKEVNYATRENKQLFFKQEEITKKVSRIDLSYSYRPDVKQRNNFRISYNEEQVDDTVLKINPLFYPGQQNKIKYFDFSYQYKLYNVDYAFYPTKGLLFEGNLYKRGIDNLTALWQASTRAIYAIPLSKSSFVHLEGFAMLKLPFNDYFFNQRLYGYGYFQMRGLEYNVVDGMVGGSLKTTFHKKVLSFVVNNPISSKTHDKIPFKIYLKIYGDLGYGYAPTPIPDNTLNNTLLKTWGFGMDIVSIYDFVFKFEFSFNQLGRDGLYLHTRNDF